MELNGNKNVQAFATVTVKSDGGALVGNAEVIGEWTGLVTGGDTSRVTDESGTTEKPFYSQRTSASGEFKFCVTDIIADGLNFEQGDNDCDQQVN